MEENLLSAARKSEFEHRNDLVLMTVNAAWRKEAEHVQCRVFLYTSVDGFG